jgi:iron complex outermembrane receptor protein
MKQTIILSLATAIALNAAELEKMEVTDTPTESINDISKEQVDSIDLAESLDKKSATVELVRGSSVNNDIIIRGQKKDNITVTIDGAKVCGACPNRMDPPISHVSSDYVEMVEIKKGPFDVSNFGSLSAGVEVKTIDPKEGFEGKISADYGSFNYIKGGLFATGGTELFQALVGYTYEQSDQYLDGNGKSMSEQTAELTSMKPMQYSDDYADALAYKKQTAIAKGNLDISDNQNLEASIVYNRADDVLYPSRSMDADVEQSTVINTQYVAKELLGALSKELMIKYYNSSTEHPMSVSKRNYTLATPPKEKVNQTYATIQGAKLENTFDIGADLKLGYDMSLRTWSGDIYDKADLENKMMVALPDTATTNHGIYLSAKKEIDLFEVSLGGRYDMTTVDTDSTDYVKNMMTDQSGLIGAYEDKSYNNFSANLLGTYNLNESSSLYIGFGQSSRVPDAVELYYSMSGSNWIGNDELNPTINQEFDLGGEIAIEESAVVSFNGFYSMQTDYIYAYQNSSSKVTYTNLDATFYGGDAKLKYFILDTLALNTSVAYTRGIKQEAIEGQSDPDMADVRPLKALASLDYDDNTYFGSFGVKYVAADSDIDSDNGEQELPEYYTLNAKAGIKKAQFKWTVGVDNMLNAVYKSTNTYYGTKILYSSDEEYYSLNDMGMFLYTKLEYQF